MNGRIRHTCLLIAGALLLVLVIPFAVVGYWTLFVTGSDAPIHQTTAQLLAAAELTDSAPHPPIIIVHGLQDGDRDYASDCAATDGPFAYTTLLAAGNYIPLHNLQRVYLFHENDGLVGAWSAIGMLFDANGQPQWAAWTKPNPPTVYFVNNKHAVSRRAGYAYAEAPAPGKMSEAYHCIRYTLGKVTARPEVCRTLANPRPAILNLGPKVVED